MSKIFFEVEDDVVTRYTPMPEAGENIYKTEVVMTKEIFQECYKRGGYCMRRLIDAVALLDTFMRYTTQGGAESIKDCAEFNRMIKDAETVNVWNRDDEEGIDCSTCKKYIIKPFIRSNGEIFRYNIKYCPHCGSYIKRCGV